jgi:hypothetical protein
MSDDQKVYVVFTGIVQAFVKDGVKQPAVTMNTTQNNQVVYNMTIQTPKQSYLDLSFWGADFGDAPAGITEGTFLAGKGSYSERTTDQGKVFKKVSVFMCHGGKPMVKLAREGVNEQAPASAPAATAGTVAQPTAEQIAAFVAAQAAATAAATPAAAASAAAPAAEYDF